ncbi:MAG: hypothetical protein IPM26_03820 [Saprospiraceae bacterium]|nr:hypothetical protein [Saprospiraceae bacterium]
MKTLLYPVLLIVIIFLLQLFLPWWILAVICFAAAYLYKPGFWLSFASAFIAGFTVWFIKSWLSDSDGHVAMLTGNILGGLSPISVLLLTGFTGALTGGLSGLSGQMINELTINKKLL